MLEVGEDWLICVNCWVRIGRDIIARSQMTREVNSEDSGSFVQSAKAR